MLISRSYSNTTRSSRCIIGSSTMTASGCLAEEESPRLREVLLAREEFTRFFYDGTFESDADVLEQYFMNYAIAARNCVLLNTDLNDIK